MTTIDTITTQQLETLRDEAGAAGDDATYTAAVTALRSDDEAEVAEALAVCVRVIRAAEAMA